MLSVKTLKVNLRNQKVHVHVGMYLEPSTRHSRYGLLVYPQTKFRYNPVEEREWEREGRSRERERERSIDQTYAPTDHKVPALGWLVLLTKRSHSTIDLITQINVITSRSVRVCCDTVDDEKETKVHILLRAGDFLGRRRRKILNNYKCMRDRNILRGEDSCSACTYAYAWTAGHPPHRANHPAAVFKLSYTKPYTQPKPLSHDQFTRFDQSEATIEMSCGILALSARQLEGAWLTSHVVWSHSFINAACGYYMEVVIYKRGQSKSSFINAAWHNMYYGSYRL